jgi:hypothetical protein
VHVIVGMVSARFECNGRAGRGQPDPARLHMTEYLIVTRAAIVLLVNLAVIPVELVLDAIEAELKRRGLEP